MYGSSHLSHVRGDRQCTRAERTEIANQVGFPGIGSPFAVRHFSMSTDVEAELEISFAEVVVAAFVLFDGVLELSEQIMPLNDTVNVGLKPRVDVQDGLRLQRLFGHSRDVVGDGGGKRAR